jgi:hypothetical protein
VASLRTIRNKMNCIIGEFFMISKIYVLEKVEEVRVRLLLLRAATLVSLISQHP